MKNIIKLEELYFTIGAFYFYTCSILGYQFGYGYCYSSVQTFRCWAISSIPEPGRSRITFFTIGALLGFASAGYFLHLPVLLTTGILLAAHSSFNRVFGYGLQFEDDFKRTHLGWLPGKNKVAIAA